MKISYDWLKEYIDIHYTPAELANILTNIGLEVEGMEIYEPVKGGLKGCVIGEVITCKKHPESDRFSITTVNIGQREPLNIVCGAPNVRKGQKVVVATAGTTLWKGEEKLTLQKTKLRGVLSEGMICAEDEIGFGNTHEGIMVLPPDARIGMAASEYFNLKNDTIFEIGLTPNRIDCSSHYGVARDLAAWLSLQGDIRLRKPQVDGFIQDNDDLHIDVVIGNTQACKRYSGITIAGIKVEESPKWLKYRLQSIGLNPINNVVDITNFVLHELGQPLHAFDADKITGNKIVVRTMEEGTPFVALDGEKRLLSSEDLLICNAHSGMCIAGVLGGIDSGVTSETKNIFLESAWFNPVYIRRTSKRHNLSTDASFRFERGADPGITVFALKHAARLIREITGGKISSPVVDVYPEPINPAIIDIHFKNIDRLTGNRIERKIIKKILQALEIVIEKENDRGMRLSVPTYRVDVKREVDVMEEILRLFGYNNISFDHHLSSVLSHSEKPDKERITNLISNYLSANGFNEIMNNSLSKEIYYKDDPQSITLFNPLSNDLNRLRTTLFYGGLETIAYNINRQRPNLRLYEFGNCYYYNEKASGDHILSNYLEEEHLALFITGNRSENNWTGTDNTASYYELKGYLENILIKLGIQFTDMDVQTTQSGFLNSGLSLVKNKTAVGQLGIVHDKWLKLFDIKSPVFYSELNWNLLLALLHKEPPSFKDLPRFPEVKRDLSMILEKNVKFEDIRKLAIKTEKQYLKKVFLFDIYEGEKIEKGKKSYAISFILQDENKTLTDKQIEAIVNKLAGAFEKRFGAQIRRS